MSEKPQIRQEREAHERDAAIERLKTAVLSSRETILVATADVRAILGYVKELESWIGRGFHDA